MSFRYSPRTALALLFPALALAACNGSAATTVDGGAGERPVSGTSEAGAIRDTRTLDLVAPEAPPPLPPAPAPNMMSKTVADGRARMVGFIDDTCSNQVPASGNGDRWCAFTLPDKQIGKTDLWVVNVTKVAAGTKVTCTGGDPNCLLMTSDLWTGQPMGNVPKHPTTHRFDGDTLIFHANADPGLTEYKGKIFAWRPGMAASKQISGNQAFNCSAHFLAEVFVCVENLSDPAVDPFTFDLTAGKLSDAAPTVVDHIVPQRPGTQSSQWRVAISRDGSTLAWSTGGTTVAQTETLWTVKYDDLAAVGTKKTMLGMAGVSRWQISGDGTKVYYLRGYNYPAAGTDPSGNLYVADFPAGTNEVQLVPNVAAFSALSAATNVDSGVGFFDGVKAGTANYRILRDRTKPADITTVVQNVPGILGLSRDLRFLFYNKQEDQDTGLTDGYVVKTDGTGNCTISSNVSILGNVFGAAFSPNSSMVMWVDNVDLNDGVADGYVANPDGCVGKKKWADRADFWFFHGNDGMVFTDTAGAEASELKYVTFTGGTTIGQPVSIQKQIARIFGLTVDQNLVLYNIAGVKPGDPDGLYAFQTPFTGTGLTDGGAPPAPAPDAAAGQ
jgi:hypothetical protein